MEVYLKFNYYQMGIGDFDSSMYNMNLKQDKINLFRGVSGSGKTLLFKSIMGVAPSNLKIEGNVSVVIDGEEIELSTLDKRKRAEIFAYVSQNPDNQIVTDLVWHEMAFGLENQGRDSDYIRSRVAEVATYFGIQDWFDKKIEDLSGGQKQILNLASAICCDPKVLILDEPLAQLDPISMERFVGLVEKLCFEDRMLVIIAEHNYPINESNYDLIKSYNLSGIVASVYENYRSYIKSITKSDRYTNADVIEYPKPIVRGEREEGRTIIKVRELRYRYEKYKEVLKGVDLDIKEGITSFIGANGSGKSTLMKEIARKKPKDGRVITDKTISMMPQDVQTMFTGKTVDEEVKCLSEVIEFLPKDNHPFDLSGGEQQLLGVLKLITRTSDVLIMDEPTKGMSNQFKDLLIDLIKDVKEQGRSVLIVSHDLEFVSRVSDKVVFLFNGDVMKEGTADEVLLNNKYFTTFLVKRHPEWRAMTIEEIENYEEITASNLLDSFDNSRNSNG